MENRLKHLRKEQKISQADMAKLIDVTPQAYSRYELGQRELGYEMLCKLADYFNVSVDYLIGHEKKAVAERTTAEIELQNDIYFNNFKKLYKIMTEAQKIFCFGMIVGYLKEQGVDTRAVINY